MSGRPAHGRRGDMFIFMLNIFFLFAVILIFSKLHAAFALQNEGEGIGTRQAALLHTYGLSEQLLLYTDEAAKFAAYESLASAMGHGGTNPVTPKCPETYVGYPQWTRSKASQCFPDAKVNGTVYDVFKKEMVANMRKLLAYPGFPPGMDYDIQVEPGNGLKVIGIAQEQITLPIVAAKDSTQLAITPLLRQDNIAKASLDFTPDTALQAAVQPSMNRKPRVAKVDGIVIQSTLTEDKATALEQYDQGTISTHYLIDDDGIITQIVPEDQQAFGLCDSDGCRRQEQRSIIISLVNDGQFDMEGGKCDGEVLKDEWCASCKQECWDSYSPEQIDALEKLLADIVQRKGIPVQNIKLQEQLFQDGNPGPALKKGNSQHQWLADMLSRIAADTATAKTGESYAAQDSQAQPSAISIAAQNALSVTLPLDDVRLTSCFGHRDYSAKGSAAGEDHGGIDFAAPIGTPVHAIADGVVQKACNNCPGTTGFGNNILIKHSDTLLSHYAHLSQMNVKAGDTVKKGQVIGLVGNTGLSGGAHLHFAIFTHPVENPISKDAANALCIFPDEQLRRIQGKAANCHFDQYSHSDAQFEQACAGITPGASTPDCSLNSAPSDAHGDDRLTQTLALIDKTPGLKDALKQAEQESLVDQRLIVSQIVHESDGRSDLVTFDGGVGISQFTDVELSKQMFQGIGDTSHIKACKCIQDASCKSSASTCDAADPRLDPRLSVRAQARLISKNTNMYAKYTDKIQFGLAAYNTGPGNVNKAITKAKAEANTDDPRWEIVSKYVHPITQAYVPDILKHYAAQGGNVATAFSDMECNNFNVRQMGTYTFAPSFTVVVPDLLTAVNRTAEWAKKTYAECDGKTDTRACLAQHEQEFNKNTADLEASSCEEPQTAALYDLQQVIDDCEQNKQDGCVCAWTPKGERGKILLSSTKGLQASIYEAPLDAHALPQASYYQGREEQSSIVLSVGDRNEVTLSDPDGGNARTIEVDAFNFVKRGDKLMLTFDKTDACGVYKTTHQVCVQVKHKIPLLTKGADFETPKIKFALYLNDSNPPEAVQQLSATATAGLAVTFRQSPSDDVSYYKVACAPSTMQISDKGEVFVDARDHTVSGDKLKADPVTAYLPLCNGIPAVYGQNYKVRVVPYDISGNKGKEATYDTSQNEATVGVGVPKS